MIIELFSTRRKRLEQAGKEDVFSYGVFPGPLRTQLQQIFSEGIGPSSYEVGGYVPQNDDAWEFIRKSICREKGKHRLAGVDNAKIDTLNFLGNAPDVEDVIDTCELCCRYIDKVLLEKSSYQLKELGIEVSAADSLEEFNYRLRMAAVGYAYEDGQIIRIDSQLVHEEVVKPALRILQQKGYEGPRQEFHQAFSHLRTRDNKDAIVWANKAFESTMKTICAKKGWPVDKGARASDLVKVLRSNGLLPSYLDNSFDQLAAVLSSGLPQVRNNEAGHGSGPIPSQTPDYVAAFAVHLAAAKIVFLAEAAAK